MEAIWILEADIEESHLLRFDLLGPRTLVPSDPIDLIDGNLRVLDLLMCQRPKIWIYLFEIFSCSTLEIRDNLGKVFY